MEKKRAGESLYKLIIRGISKKTVFFKIIIYYLTNYGGLQENKYANKNNNKLNHRFNLLPVKILK